MDSKNGGRHSCCVHGDYLLDWKAPLETLHRAEDFYRLLSGRSGETLDQGQEPGKRQRRRALWMLRGDKRPVEKVPFTVARLVRSGDEHDPTEGFRFVSENQAAYPIATMCRLLGVSPSGYYGWVSRRSPADIDPGVVRSQQAQSALGLIGDHFDDVGQVLALGGELDHSPLAEVVDPDALGKVATL
jgi:hypothetical protein